MRTIGERVNSQQEMLSRFGDALSAQIRVAIPGVVVSFDATEQTVSVQPAIREKVRDKDGNVRDVALPIIPDVPIVMPRAGGLALTLPVQAGDECILLFQDMCEDGWWQSGGTQNQMERRRHDLSDPVALFGAWSQPRVLSNYSTTSAQLRTDDGATYIDIRPGAINLVATNVQKNGVAL